MVCDSSWMITGNFYYIAYLSEYSRTSTIDLGAISYFADFISLNALWELLVLGGIFTWFGDRATS